MAQQAGESQKPAPGAKSGAQAPGGATPGAAKGGAATSAATRREHQRLDFERQVKVSEIDDAGNPGPEWLCRAVDISRGGIGLRSRRMVHEGRKLFIRVPAGPGGKEKLLFGAVKQSRYQEGEGFVIGVKFEETPKTWAITKWLTTHGVSAPVAGAKPQAA
ncbi:MAG: PilZ domain-containing protein [Phycisphaerales bacterium]